MDNNFCYSEKNIIKKALLHTRTNTASKEEKIIAKLCEYNKLQIDLNKIYDEIILTDTKDKAVKQAFQDLENAYRKAYNAIYDNYGRYHGYAFQVIIEYLQDVYVDKFTSLDKENNNKIPTKTFILLELVRNEMTDDWYSLTEIYKIVKEVYPEYSSVLTRQNINLMINYFTEDGYFEEKREAPIRRPEMVRHRYFRKTKKEYIDYIEQISVAHKKDRC